MSDEAPAYGLWSLVIINSLVFIIFAFSFGKPRSPRDWRSFGAFSAFIVALFTEMYGFPLTIYLLSGWLQVRYPGLDLMSHDAGHLWATIFGLKGDPHFGENSAFYSALGYVRKDDRRSGLTRVSNPETPAAPVTAKVSA